MVRVSKVTRTSTRLSHSPAKLETAEDNARPVTRAEKQRASTLVEFGNAVLKLEATTSQPSLRSNHHGYNLRSTRKRTSEVSPHDSTNSVRRPQGLSTASGARPRTETASDGTIKITPAPRAAPKRKRPPSPSVLDERPTKGRRSSDEAQTTEIRARLALRREMRTMSNEASAVRDLVAHTEEAVIRTMARVRDLRKATRKLCKQAASFPVNTALEPDVIRDRSSAPARGTHRIQPPSPTQPADSRHNPLVITPDVTWPRYNDPERYSQDYSDAELASIYRTMLDGMPAVCICRPTTLQRRHFEHTKYNYPRPRFGVDQQGAPFQDWSVVPRGKNRRRRRLAKEDIVANELFLDQAAPDENVCVLPAPRRPRRPRAFSTAFTLQFRHIPTCVLDTMELWHVQNGRCLSCIAMAMRTFPPWIVEAHSPERVEEGNPIYVNQDRDEMIEWDEARKRWRHLVLDHYRWTPVQDLEERPVDNAADPLIVNGSSGRPVPRPCRIFYGCVLDTHY
ncbi:hypothetical protein PUNSTDRAFT_138458 [Punctularia strigosozonata HHB-11173 SS5]|uniref:Uncharacterized protein n=1 Tax=Punctularia strigosozonata (strain HHB-11173) TaxID=741275 RepID=R7S532_PUNST|nr:uncharacterized protein PUNSTDRAFT_138458 [Punctularia strigosozonata HHB-11173 SS5]EIN04416.1 hypothetical protein PUNSTDRAFT_138458 [Punctularia strigosozonata HHB-11173 SS5]